jgi:transcription factor STE12
MYPNHQHPSMPPPQQRSVAPETFLLAEDAQQSLPADSVVALQQVDNRTYLQTAINVSVNKRASANNT